MVIHGHKLTDRFKIQKAFIMEAILMFSLPFIAHLSNSPSSSFWSCFFALLAFGCVNGIV